MPTAGLVVISTIVPCILQLHTPLQFNDFVQPICLPGNDEDVVGFDI